MFFVPQLIHYFIIFFQISGASGPNEEHLMCVINKDMTDQKEVFGVEKAIRNVPIRFAIQYKPLIYTEYVFPPSFPSSKNFLLGDETKSKTRFHI